MIRNNNNNNDDEGDDHGGDPGAYQGKATSPISVSMFKSGVDDSEISVEYFTNAVLKQARSVAWGPLKEELTTLSVDPQEKNISGKRRYPP